MFRIVYNIAIRFYYLIIYIASFFNAKAKKWIRGRQHIPSDIEPLFTSKKQSIWFHCASVGEFEQGLPLLHLLKNEFPKYQYHVTFFSPSGYDYATQKYPELSISYLPFDSSSNLDYFIRKVNPKLVFIVKYEYWYNLLYKLNSRSIPCYLISGILRPDHIFFKWHGKPFQHILNFFQHFFVQDSQSKALLKSIGFENCSITGDTRFDRVLALSQESFFDQKINDFIDNNPVFIAGSIWKSDTPVLIKIIERLPKNWKIIIAPHEIQHFSTNWATEDVHFYTQEVHFNNRILILDTIGILSRIYRFATLCYVGGGYGKGLHNILEPAIFGNPILIGPHYKKFNEAVQLVKLGCVFPINLDDNMKELIENLTENLSVRESISAKSFNYFSINTNVSEKIAVYLRKHTKL